MNSIKVGKIVYYLLSNDKEITDKVGKKIYPLVANDDVTFPFIVFKRKNLFVESTKDRYIHREEANVEIVVASTEYQDSIDIASSIITRMIKTKNQNIYNINVKSISFDGADEDYVDDSFIQILNFKIIL